MNLISKFKLNNALKAKNRQNERSADFAHLDTITYAPVGNPNVSDRRNEHFRTSYQSQYISPETEPNQLMQSQSQPVSFENFNFY